MNCLRSVPAFGGCFLELNDVYWVLRSTNMFFKVSRYFYDESEFIVAPLSPLRGQSFLSQNSTSKTRRRLNVVTTQHFAHIFLAARKGQYDSFPLNNHAIDISFFSTV